MHKTDPINVPSEQVANQLWAGYAAQNKDDFWQSYEALMVLQKTEQKSRVDRAILDASLLQNFSTQVYHNSFWRLFVEVAIANIALTCIWFSLKLLLKAEGGGWQLLIVFYIIPWLGLISNYHSFSLHPHGLLIKKIGYGSDKFTWREIKQIEFVVVKQIRYLKIFTYGDTYTIRAAMSGKQREELKTAIEYYINTPMPSRI